MSVSGSADGRVRIGATAPVRFVERRRGGVIAVAVTGDGDNAAMVEGDLVRGLELRYLLTTLLLDAGRPVEVHEMVRWLEAHGYAVTGRPGKTVSDGLRWEVRRGRVVHVRPGRYVAGSMPRSTKSRIRARVRAIAGAAERASAAAALRRHSVGA